MRAVPRKRDRTAATAALIACTASFIGPVARAGDVTLSDTALLMLDWYAYGEGGPGTDPPVVVARRDVPGPGVEFDIRFATAEHTVLYVLSSTAGGAGCLGGLDLRPYSNYSLTFNYVAVDGFPHLGAQGLGIWVGTPVDFAYRNVGLNPGQSRVCATEISAIGGSSNITSMGFNIFRATPDAWPAGVHTLTLHVAPTSGAAVLLDGPRDDCNENGVFDLCEPDEDCNTNGVRDICDLYHGLGEDCNANSRHDACESQADCDENNTPDICQLAGGASPDCNRNAVPDECDLATGTSADRNATGVPDECEVGACCFPDLTCQETIDIDCTSGNWTGGSRCVPNPCPCCSSPGACVSGCDLTFSDAALLALDSHSYSGAVSPADRAVVIGRRDVPGPGVEFDIRFPGLNNTLMWYESSRYGGAGCLTRLNEPRYGRLRVRFTYLSMDGGIPENPGRYAIWFGVGVNGAYRNEGIDPGESGEEYVTVSGVNRFDRVGWNVFRATPDYWNPLGNVITVRVEPVEAAAPLIASGPEDCNGTGLVDACERGDADGDGRTTLRDVSRMLDCFSVPGASSLRPCCTSMDFDDDGDVDPDDFSRLWVRLAAGL